MKYECVIGKMRDINSNTDKFFTKRINEERMPILINHIPLFYILSFNKEPILFNELSKEWGISKSSLSDIINKYQKLGFVNKYSCNDDKRSVYLSLTEEGVKIKDMLGNFEMELIEFLFKDFDTNEREVFEKRIDHVLRNSNSI